MKVMLTGGKGMLGRTLCKVLSDFEVIPTDLPGPARSLTVELISE